ncbi:MAG: cytochrome c biogenesis protein CcsA, partial [Actinomycetota bacterium]
MAELGRFAVLLALGAGLWGAVAAAYGARTGRPEAVKSAEGAVKASALCFTAAAAVLFYLLLTKDFRVEYVAEYSSRSLSTFYALAAFWAGQAGSLLLWGWVLSLFSVVVVYQNRAKNRAIMPYVLLTLSVVVAFFGFLVAFTSSPFRTLAVVPFDGQGLNPLLQNPGQWVHPVTLYLGYVGFTVPFAFCIGALASGRLDDEWLRSVRKWTLWSWVLLTAGIVLGARWAYVELGWGGYWAWDPVENASLLPWLTGTAFLHSVIVQERKGMLKVWNAGLAVTTFALSLFGTFLTRSGVISSVHAFAQSSLGPYLIAATAAAVLAGGALIVWRLPELRSREAIESPISREASFLANNLLLV